VEFDPDERSRRSRRMQETVTRKRLSDAVRPIACRPSGSSTHPPTWPPSEPGKGSRWRVRDPKRRHRAVTSAACTKRWRPGSAKRRMPHAKGEPSAQSSGKTTTRRVAATAFQMIAAAHAMAGRDAALVSTRPSAQRGS